MAVSRRYACCMTISGYDSLRYPSKWLPMFPASRSGGGFWRGAAVGNEKRKDRRITEINREIVSAVFVAARSRLDAIEASAIDH